MIQISDLRKKEGFKQGRWVTDEEGNLITELISRHGSLSYFESGTANGFSALWAASGLPSDGKVYTFDPVDREKLWNFPEMEKLKPKIRFYQDQFKNLGKYVDDMALTGRPFAFFIDGDHGQGSVLEDWATIKPFLRSGDMIIFHDLEMRTVQKAWDKILDTAPATSTVSKYNTRRKINVLYYGV